MRPAWLVNQLSAQSRLQRERRAAGRCLRCGTPTDPKPGGGYYARCEAHRLENAWQKKRLPEMPANGWRA